MNSLSLQADVTERPRLRDLAEGRSPEIPAALIILFSVGREDAEDALAFARSWQSAVPDAAFVGVELRRKPTLLTLGKAVNEIAQTRAVDPRQLVLVGRGEAGGLAVRSVLEGAIAAACVIGLDVLLGPDCAGIQGTTAMVRLVQHRSQHDPQMDGLTSLVEAMRRTEVDVRSLVLPVSAQTDPAVARRALGIFLVEAVAQASHVTRGSRSPA